MLRNHRGLLSSVCLAAGLLAPCGLAWSADAPPAKRAAAAPAAQGAVDVNTASEDELVAVPGIGKGLARRIVDFREKNGPYQHVDDLLKVQGIGEKSLQKLRPHLIVGKNRS